MVVYIRKKHRLFKLAIFTGIAMVLSLFGGNKGNYDDLVSLRDLTPLASADTPYSQGSYYSEGSYGKYNQGGYGGKGGGGGGGGDGDSSAGSGCDSSGADGGAGGGDSGGGSK